MPSNRYPLIAREAWSILFVLLGLSGSCASISWTCCIQYLHLQFYSLRYISFVIRLESSHLNHWQSSVRYHGVVTLIEEAEEIRLHNKAIRVQITMRFHDIYSFRSPIEGKVMEQWCSAPNKNESRRHFDFYIKSDEGDDVVTAIRLKRY